MIGIMPETDEERDAFFDRMSKFKHIYPIRVDLSFAKTNDNMELNELKKKLYKEQPIAKLYEVRRDGIVYTTYFGEDTVTFLVPLDEVGDVIWERDMPAKLLIRYIVK